MICPRRPNPISFELLDANAHLLAALGNHPPITHIDRIADDEIAFEFALPDGRIIAAAADLRLIQ